jgi:pilus assembly protein CpaC
MGVCCHCATYIQQNRRLGALAFGMPDIARYNPLWVRLLSGFGLLFGGAYLHDSACCSRLDERYRFRLRFGQMSRNGRKAMAMEDLLKGCRLAVSELSGIVNRGAGRLPPAFGGTAASVNKALMAKIGHWKAKKQACIASAAICGYLVLAFLSGVQGLAPGFFISPSHAAGFADGVSPDAGRVLDIIVSHGRVLRFDEPVESVFLGDPSIADLRIISPDMVYIFGKKLGTTNLIAISKSGQVVAPGEASSLPSLQASLRLQVVADSDPPNDARRELEPQSVVTINLFGRRVVASGRARSIDEAVNIDNIAQTYSPPGQPPINAMTLDGSQQVNIRVRFAEVSRADLQTLGINWQMFNTGNFTFGFLGNGSQLDGTALADSLQRNGVINVLAEPNLTAVTGQTARFLAGGEIPIPVPQGGNGNAVTLQYKPFGVSLVFTPVLIRKNRIALHVNPEVSMMSTAGAVKVNGVEAPAFMVRRADTTIELGSGQTFALGGLFQRQLSQNDDIDKMPFLSDVPVMGALFRSPRFRRNETELVILITAYLVKPISDRNVVTPLSRPTDALRAVQAQNAAARSEAPSKQSAKDPGPRTGMIVK